jgi:hypothetical protein
MTVMVHLLDYCERALVQTKTKILPSIPGSQASRSSRNCGDVEVPLIKASMADWLSMN